MSVLNAPDSEAVTSSAVSGHLDPDAQRLLGMLTNGRFIALVATPYWERLWIIQEVVLASSVKMVIEDSIWHLHDFKHVLDVVIRTAPLVRRVQSLRAITLKTQPRLELKGYEGDDSDTGDGESSDGDEDHMPGGGLWDDALTLTQDTGCNVPLDRVYGVMGLVPEYLRVPPGYEISMTELLSRVLLKVASHGFRRRPQYMWIGMYEGSLPSLVWLSGRRYRSH